MPAVRNSNNRKANRQGSQAAVTYDKQGWKVLPQTIQTSTSLLPSSAEQSAVASDNGSETDPHYIPKYTLTHREAYVFSECFRDGVAVIANSFGTRQDLSHEILDELRVSLSPGPRHHADKPTIRRPRNCFMLFRSFLGPLAKYRTANQQEHSRVSTNNWKACARSGTQGPFQRLALLEKAVYKRVKPNYHYNLGKQTTKSKGTGSKKAKKAQKAQKIAAQQSHAHVTPPPQVPMDYGTPALSSSVSSRESSAAPLSPKSVDNSGFDIQTCEDDGDYDVEDDESIVPAVGQSLTSFNSSVSKKAAEFHTSDLRPTTYDLPDEQFGVKPQFYAYNPYAPIDNTGAVTAVAASDIPQYAFIPNPYAPAIPFTNPTIETTPIPTPEVIHVPIVPSNPVTPPSPANAKQIPNCPWPSINDSEAWGTYNHGYLYHDRHPNPSSTSSMPHAHEPTFEYHDHVDASFILPPFVFPDPNMDGLADLLGDMDVGVGLVGLTAREQWELDSRKYEEGWMRYVNLEMFEDAPVRAFAAFAQGGM